MIDLTALVAQVATPRLLRWGSTLAPVLGGVTQKLDRVGSRFAIDVQTAPMPVEPFGRQRLALLQLALHEGGFVRFHQLGFNPGLPGAPTVDGAHAGGMTLSVTGANANVIVRQGQFLNITKSGRQYLYCAAANVQLDGSGDGDIELTTMLRTQLAGGESVELRKPMIEGWVTGDELAWTINTSHAVGLSFGIEERA